MYIYMQVMRNHESMKDALNNILSAYNFFQECIIEDIKFDHFGSQVKIDFQYIYDNDGIIEPEPKRIVSISFKKVREFRMVNAWNKSQLEKMENLN